MCPNARPVWFMCRDCDTGGKGCRRLSRIGARGGCRARCAGRLRFFGPGGRRFARYGGCSADAGMQDARSYARTNRRRFVEELKQFVRFPTVSADARRRGALRDCAQWLASHLRQIGLTHVRVLKHRTHPLVYAASRVSAETPTVLIYGHYDVQPAESSREWHSPPFSPVVRDADLYGRGASDDKGQMFAHVKALESYMRTSALPVNVKCVFEGAEEIGSPGLAAFVGNNRRALGTDVAVISDMLMPAPGRPAITYSGRGALGVELEVRGPRHDLHSGNFGGAVPNPLQALAEMVSRMHDSEGRVAIPGFYDRVREWSGRERRYLESSGPSDDRVLRDAEVESDWGDRGFSMYERITIRPALTVNGMSGGYEGTGEKAVIPSRAVAKLSFRLVVDQDPRDIERLFRAYVAEIAPLGVRCQVRTLSSVKPVLVDRGDPFVRAGARACEKAFGAPAVFLRSGGSFPVAAMFQQELGVPVVMMGFGLPDDRIHGPNERFHLPNYFNAIDASIRFLSEAGRVRRGGSQALEEEFAAV